MTESALILAICCLGAAMLASWVSVGADLLAGL
jgi:hypothetical protein